MNKVYVNQKDLSKFKRLRTIGNVESSIYVDDKTLYKVLFPFYRDKHREKNIELLSEFEHPNCVFPKDKIMNRDNGHFWGITEEYLRAYTTLSDVLENGNLDFETRKKLAHKLCEIQRFLNDNNISFIDMHTHNVMINNDNDLKVVDLDGCDVLLKKHSPRFELRRNKVISKNLARICFQLLYGEDCSINIANDNKYIEILNNSDKRHKDFLEVVFDVGHHYLYTNNIIDVEEHLDNFSENDMEECKLVLHK